MAWQGVGLGPPTSLRRALSGSGGGGSGSRPVCSGCGAG